MLPKLEKGKPRSLPGVVCSKYPQCMTLSCKTSKVNPAGKAAKHQEKLWKISVHAQKISSQQIEYKNDIYDLSKAKTKAEKCIWNDCRKVMIARKKVRVCESLKGGLLLESCPK
jgi:hypothetical protein